MPHAELNSAATETSPEPDIQLPEWRGLCRVAVRAENKGRRRSSEGGSRRWQRSMLPCIAADSELSGGTESGGIPALVPSSSTARCSEESTYTSEPGHMSSPFASAQQQGCMEACSEVSGSGAVAMEGAVASDRCKRTASFRGGSPRGSSPRCVIM